VRILIIGAISFPGSLESSYYRAFKKMKGVEIVLFDIEKKSLFKRVLGNGILDRAKRRIYFHLKNNFLRKKFLHYLKNGIYKDIDLVVDFKSYWLTPNILRVLKQNTKALIFHINPDSPFDKIGGNFHSNLKDCIHFYDCYFTYSKKLVPKLYKLKAKRVKHLPFAWDPELHPVININSDDIQKYKSDIAFIGNWTPEREKWLESIADMDLTIWGTYLWERLRKNSLLIKKLKGVVIGEEFVKVCRASKINLNFLRPQNKDSHNMRTFEVPGCGGFLLTERSKEQCEFFKEGKEIACFSTPEELREKIEYYLSHEEERKKMVKAAHEKVKNYTYLHRAKRILEVYEELKS